MPSNCVLCVLLCVAVELVHFSLAAGSLRCVRRACAHALPTSLLNLFCYRPSPLSPVLLTTLTLMATGNP